MTQVYEEVIDFIAAGASSDAVAAFRPSEQALARVADLIAREKATGLNPTETRELEHLMRFTQASYLTAHLPKS